MPTPAAVQTGWSSDAKSRTFAGGTGDASEEETESVHPMMTQVRSRDHPLPVLYPALPARLRRSRPYSRKDLGRDLTLGEGAFFFFFRTESRTRSHVIPETPATSPSARDEDLPAPGNRMGPK